MSYISVKNQLLDLYFTHMIGATNVYNHNKSFLFKSLPVVRYGIQKFTHCFLISSEIIIDKLFLILAGMIYYQLLMLYSLSLCLLVTSGLHRKSFKIPIYSIWFFFFFGQGIFSEQCWMISLRTESCVSYVPEVV